MPPRPDPASARHLAWQPGLARALATEFDAAHAARLARGYSSAGWLRLGSYRLESSRVPGLATAHFELLTGPARERYAALGLALADARPSAADIDLLCGAVRLLDVGGQLLDAVQMLVRSIHPLRCAEPGFDTSHSDPELPFSIFVSIPSDENAPAPRLAESILHETMHLQLTLLEAREPLVRPSTLSGYSPWQKVQRPIRGLVHGLFVFRVIQDWLDALWRKYPNRAEITNYAARRRGEITAEIDSLGDLATSPALTPAGAHAVRQWCKRP